MLDLNKNGLRADRRGLITFPGKYPSHRHAPASQLVSIRRDGGKTDSRMEGSRRVENKAKTHIAEKIRGTREFGWSPSEDKPEEVGKARGAAGQGDSKSLYVSLVRRDQGPRLFAKGPALPHSQFLVLWKFLPVLCSCI